MVTQFDPYMRHLVSLLEVLEREGFLVYLPVSSFVIFQGSQGIIVIGPFLSPGAAHGLLPVIFVSYSST